MVYTVLIHIIYSSSIQVDVIGQQGGGQHSTFHPTRIEKIELVKKCFTPFPSLIIKQKQCYILNL